LDHEALTLGLFVAQTKLRMLVSQNILNIYHAYVECSWLLGMLMGCQRNDKIGRFYSPILSACKIARQKSVVCHAKIARFRRPTKSLDFVGQDRACSIFYDFVGQLFEYRTTNVVYVAMVIVYNGR